MNTLYFISGLLFGVGVTNLTLGKKSEWAILIIASAATLAAAIYFEVTP